MEVKRELSENGLLDWSESDAESEPDSGDLFDNINAQRLIMVDRIRSMQVQVKTMDRLLKKRKA